MAIFFAKISYFPSKASINVDTLLKTKTSKMTQKWLKIAIFGSFLAKRHIRDTPEHSRILDIFGKSANIKLSNKKQRKGTKNDYTNDF